MSKKNSIRSRVTRGIELLNKKRPTWCNSIDLVQLNLGSSQLCVLGMVYADAAYKGKHMNDSGFGIGIDRLFTLDQKSNVPDYIEQYGFDTEIESYESLEREWKRQIRALDCA